MSKGINLQLIIKPSPELKPDLIVFKINTHSMITDLNQTKAYKSKTQPSEIVQQQKLQPQQPFVNPIIKHTFQSLPKIYGGNIHRKRKYNIFMKNRFELNSIISRSNSKAYKVHDCGFAKRCQQQRQRGQSCLQIGKEREGKHQKYESERQDISRTVLKSKKVKTQTDEIQNIEQPRGLQQIRKKKFIKPQDLDLLSKPRQKCNKQYCSCKSLYDEYQEQVVKKIRQKSQPKSTKMNISRIQLPKLSVELHRHNYTEIENKSYSRLDDRESKHKVNFRYKFNSFDNDGENCCSMCNQLREESSEKKGVLGLIKKKQMEEEMERQRERKQLGMRSATENIGVQSDDQLLLEKIEAIEPSSQDYGAQANLMPVQKRAATIDQQINTNFQDQSKSFKHLQNNRPLPDQSMKQSVISTKNKKQPMEHLSHLKQIYKYKKRPAYESKYCINEHSDQNDHCNDQQSNDSEKEKFRNLEQKQGKKRSPSQNEEEFDIAMSTDSVMSQNSLMNHIANALAGSGKDSSTIFKALKKRQLQQSSKSSESQHKGTRRTKPKKNSKQMKLVDEQKGLFVIPEQEEYVDYLKSYKPVMKDFKVKDLIKSDNFKILKYKDTLYFGQTQGNDKKHGKALFISPKQIFEGVYENGIKMSGCERNIDGVYIGEFVNGMRHGNGKFLWNNGQVFEGDWKLGTKNGHGVWKSPKGDSYEGGWLLNRQHGKGIHKHKNSIYQGEFKGSLKHGNGRERFINGDQYIGQYQEGKPHGKGKYIWKNGAFYQGDFKDGLRQGRGKWHFADKTVYEGEFKKDFKHGQGNEVYANGDRYEGLFNEGIKTNGVFFEAATGKTTQIGTKQEIKISNKNNQHTEVKNVQAQNNEKENNLSQSQSNHEKEDNDIN